MASQVLASDWFTHGEFCSENTLPLLNFCLNSKSKTTVKDIADLLHQVTADIGEQTSPLPDESEQVKNEFLKLIKEGPGKVTGSPTVSLLIP